MGQVARNVPKLFCEPQKGCLKILLLSNSEGNWEKHIIGNINCIGVGTKNNNGRRDIFKSRSTIIFDNNGIKEMDYSPNWNIPE